jgi:hypothetical protein
MTLRRFVEMLARERQSRLGGSATGRQLDGLRLGTFGTGGGSGNRNEERALRYMAMVKLWDSLSEDQRQIIGLYYLGHDGFEEYEEVLPKGQRADDPEDVVRVTHDGRLVIKFQRPRSFTHERIADVLGLTVHQVRRKLQSARTHLENHPLWSIL